MLRLIIPASVAFAAACQSTVTPATASPSQDASQAVLDRVQRQIEARPVVEAAAVGAVEATASR